MAMGPNVLNLLMGCLVILASVSDIATKTIPNWITLSGMATAVMVHTAMRGAEGCLFSLGGIAVGISLLLRRHRCRRCEIARRDRRDRRAS